MKNELRDEIVILLIASDEDMEFPEAKEFWDKWLAALNEEPWVNGKHSGDCTKEPQTCMRCLVDSYYREADQILDAVIAHLEKCPAPRATEEDACYFMKQEMIKSLKEG